MANNFTQFSEVIPRLTVDEEAWLRDQLQFVEVIGGQEYREDQVPSHLVGREPEWQGCRFLRDIEDADEYSECGAGFGYEFADDHDTPDGWDRHLWVHDDGGASLECLVHLVQKFLRRFRPQDCWSVTYAKVCSLPRVGEFGGGGIVVTAKAIKSRNAHTWVQQQRAALQPNTATGQEATA